MKIKGFSIVDFYKNKYTDVAPYLRNKNTKAITSIVLTLFTLTIFGLFAINPTLSTIANLQKQLEDSRFVDENLSRKITNLSMLQRRFNQLQGDLPVVYSAVPENPNVPTLMSQVYLIALEENVSINNLQTQEVELSKTTDAPNKYSSYIFNVSASGEYNNLLSFVNSLNRFERIVSIDTITLNTSTDLQVSAVQISIRGEAYFKK